MIFAPTAHLNRWEVIGMMDHFITLGDLLKLGSFLLDLTSVILYIYYNQKIVKRITIKRKRNNRPRIQTVAVIL